MKVMNGEMEVTSNRIKRNAGTEEGRYWDGRSQQKNRSHVLLMVSTNDWHLANVE